MIPQRKGFSLLEIIAAVVISAVVATLGVQHLRRPATDAHERSCDVTRETLQLHVNAYQSDFGRLPSAALGEIESDEYAGPQLPRCPVGDSAYRLDRRGVVQCTDHPEL